MPFLKPACKAEILLCDIDMSMDIIMHVYWSAIYELSLFIKKKNGNRKLYKIIE